MVTSSPDTATAGPSLLARLATDRRGVSAVEFALILPLMVLLFAGSSEFSEALTVDRKVNQFANTIGDLVAQRETMDTTEMNNILAAGEAIMLPYDATGVEVLVMAVNIAANGDQTVAWAEVSNDVDPANGSAPPILVPAAIASPSTQMIVTRVRYTFESPFSDILSSITGKSAYDFEHVFMLRPRLGDSVVWTS
jgi:Flp pilus assembly protein TadG